MEGVIGVALVVMELAAQLGDRRRSEGVPSASRVSLGDRDNWGSPQLGEATAKIPTKPRKKPLVQGDRRFIAPRHSYEDPVALVDTLVHG